MLSPRSLSFLTKPRQRPPSVHAHGVVVNLLCQPPGWGNKALRMSDRQILIECAITLWRVQSLSARMQSLHDCMCPEEQSFHLVVPIIVSVHVVGALPLFLRPPFPFGRAQTRPIIARFKSSRANRRRSTVISEFRSVKIDSSKLGLAVCDTGKAWCKTTLLVRSLARMVRGGREEGRAAIDENVERTYRRSRAKGGVCHKVLG